MNYVFAHWGRPHGVCHLLIFYVSRDVSHMSSRSQLMSGRLRGLCTDGIVAYAFGLPPDSGSRWDITPCPYGARLAYACTACIHCSPVFWLATCWIQCLGVTVGAGGIHNRALMDRMIQS